MFAGNLKSNSRTVKRRCLQKVLRQKKLETCKQFKGRFSDPTALLPVQRPRKSGAYGRQSPGYKSGLGWFKYAPGSRSFRWEE